MSYALSAQLRREFSGLAQAAVTVAVVGGIFLQLLNGPEAVVLFAVAGGVIFGATVAGFRRFERELEFVLTRNISRREFFWSRWAIGAIPLVFSVLLAGLNLILPISQYFWSLFVESGFTSLTALPPSEGWGWFLFSLSSSIWAYSVTYCLVARTRDAGEMFLALLAALAVTIGLPLIYLGGSTLCAALGFFERDLALMPLSILWIVFYVLTPLLVGGVLLLGARWFEKVDL